MNLPNENLPRSPFWCPHFMSLTPMYILSFFSPTARTYSFFLNQDSAKSRTRGDILIGFMLVPRKQESERRTEKSLGNQWSTEPEPKAAATLGEPTPDQKRVHPNFFLVYPMELTPIAEHKVRSTNETDLFKTAEDPTHCAETRKLRLTIKTKFCLRVLFVEKGFL